jgi:hypothetical protein
VCRHNVTEAYAPQLNCLAIWFTPLVPYCYFWQIHGAKDEFSNDPFDGKCMIWENLMIHEDMLAICFTPSVLAVVDTDQIGSWCEAFLLSFVLYDFWLWDSEFCAVLLFAPRSWCFNQITLSVINWASYSLYSSFFPRRRARASYRSSSSNSWKGRGGCWLHLRGECMFSSYVVHLVLNTWCSDNLFSSMN